LAIPVAGAEGLRELRAEAWIPAFVDAVQDSGQLVGVGAQPQQALQAATESGRGDLLRIGRADGRQVRGVDQPALQEGELVVEFEPVDVKRLFWRTDPPQRLARE